jgi:hypothetical protein
MVPANSSVRCCLAKEEVPHRVSTVPLTAAGINETEQSGLPNRSIRFSCFEQELPGPCSIRVPTTPKTTRVATCLVWNGLLTN